LAAPFQSPAGARRSTRALAARRARFPFAEPCISRLQNSQKYRRSQITDQSIPISYDNIEALGASDFATARDCITVTQQDVLHNIEPLKCVGCERLIKAIEVRQILTQDMLIELDVQVSFLMHEIDADTTQYEMYDNDVCNVSSSGSWIETHRM
jgi:hypothetical protein